MTSKNAHSGKGTSLACPVLDSISPVIQKCIHSGSWGSPLFCQSLYRSDLYGVYQKRWNRVHVAVSDWLEVFIIRILNYSLLYFANFDGLAKFRKLCWKLFVCFCFSVISEIRPLESNYFRCCLCQIS